MRKSETRPPPVASQVAPRGKFVIAGMVVVAAWCFALAVLVIATANPISLNWEQIARADYVVSATVVDRKSDRVEVHQEWKRGHKLGEIGIENLRETKGKPGRDYIIPLHHLGGNRFQIVETRAANGQPTIYPATDNVLEHLQDVLETIATNDR